MRFFTARKAILPFVVAISCTSTTDVPPVNCSLSDLILVIDAQADPTSCSSSDGQIIVSASGGKSPYSFSLNNGSFGTSATFQNLNAGEFIVTVKDASGCEASSIVSLILPGENNLSASSVVEPDTECEFNNGVIIIFPSGGNPPYELKLGSGLFSELTSFNGLASGIYTITIRDADLCQITVTANVPAGDTQTSLVADVKPIIAARCAVSTCHGGSQSPNLSTNQNIINNAVAIRREVVNNRMPPAGQPALTSGQKALILCWVDEGAKNN